MDIPELLRSAKTIAVVGISDKPGRPSNDVAGYLLSKGYAIVPVNPNLSEWRGIRAYPSLQDIPGGIHVDIVDIFRKSGDVMPVAEGAISIGAGAVWMQLGIVNEKAAAKARKAGLFVVMDRCIKVERMAMGD